MRRISHDLAGITQRIAKISKEFDHAAQETLEVWRDQKGRSFIQQHISDIRPALAQVESSMAQTIELFESIAKRLREPEL